MQGFVCGMWTVEVEGGGFGEKRCGLYCITDSFIQNLYKHHTANLESKLLNTIMGSLRSKNPMELNWPSSKME